MAQLQIDPVGTLVSGEKQIKVTFVVETRETWDGEWQRRQYIKPLNDADCVAPGIGRATYMFDYGRIKREDRNAFQTYANYDIRGHYIRTRAVSSRGTFTTWTGVVSDDAMIPYGSARGSGCQTFEAFGIVHDLDRDIVESVTVATGAGVVDGCEDVPRMNLRYKRGGQVVGNRSHNKHTDGAYVFSADGDTWSARDQIEMLLTRHVPDNGPEYVLGGQVDVLDQYHPIIDIYGKTPWRIICELVKRERGIGLAPIVSETDNTVLLYVYTILEKDLTSGDLKVPANANPMHVNFDNWLDVTSPEIHRAVAWKYDYIEVRGKPMLFCFTLAHSDGTLERRWTDNLEDDYVGAAFEAATYADLDDDEKAKLNDAYRKNPRFEPVYSKHGIPKDWDGTAGSGIGGALSPVIAKCDDDGELDFDDVIYFPLGKHFESFIPLEEGKDYSTTPPTSLNSLPADAEPDYLKPMGFVRHPEYQNVNTVNKFYLVHDVGEEFKGDDAEFKVYPRDAAFGVEATPRHVYALDQFDPETDPPSDHDPALRWSDVIATVAMRADHVVRVATTRDGLDGTERLRRKVIELPECELWHVAGGTVIGVDAAQNQIRVPNDIVVRDDRPRMREVLALGKAFYGVDRASVKFTLRRVEKIAPLGAMIVSTVTAGTVISTGTPVTSVENSYVNGGSTTVQTQWGELDFSGER